MYSVHFLPIFVSGMLCVLLSSIWYHPLVFGKAWMRLVNFTPTMIEHGKRRKAEFTLIAFLGGMLIAYVMSYFGIAWEIDTLPKAIELGFWIWVGFVAPAFLTLVLWEHRSWQLFFINVFYWLITLCSIAVVLLYVV